MAEVYSVKIESELKEDLQRAISESGQTAGEYLQMLMNAYESTQTRESMGNSIPELSQLKNHIARIEEIYVGMARSREDDREFSNRRIAELTTELTQSKADLIDKQTESKTEIERLIAELKKVRESADQDVAEATAARESAQAAQAVAQRNADLAQTVLAELQAEHTELRQDAATAKADAKEAATAKLDAERSAAAQIDALTAQIKALDKSVEQASIDQQRAVLAAERAAHEQRKTDLAEIEKLRQAMSDATHQLHVARTQIDQLQRELAITQAATE